jgi:hypothetical protein
MFSRHKNFLTKGQLCLQGGTQNLMMVDLQEVASHIKLLTQKKTVNITLGGFPPQIASEPNAPEFSSTKTVCSCSLRKTSTAKGSPLLLELLRQNLIPERSLRFRKIQLTN